MKSPLLLAVATALALAACTSETVVPAGVTLLTLDQTTTAMQRDFDEVTEARLLTRACIEAEAKGAAALGGLTKQGYIFVKDFADAIYLKQAPKSRTLEVIRSIGVQKKNDNMACTIHVRPYTHGETVLAVAGDELRRQGFTKVRTEKGSADWYRKGDLTLSVLGWVPGQTRKYMTGAEISFRRITK